MKDQFSELLNECFNPITEAMDGEVPTPDGGPRMDPSQFIGAINGIIASSPHGQQEAVLQKLWNLGRTDPAKLTALLSSVESEAGVSYLHDYFRSKGSNIMLISEIALALFDRATVMQILDAIQLGSNADDEDDEDEDLEYNSEGDGYSH